MMQTPVAHEAALRQPLPITSARVAVVRDAFVQALEPGAFRPVADGATLHDLAPVDAGAWLCQVDDRFVLREHWHYAVPPGAMVVFREMPQGGGGKQSLRILLQITLAVALNGVIPGVGFLTAGEIAVGTVLGSLAINALIPLDATNFANNGGGPQQFSGQVQQNIARIGQPIPEIFGYDYGWPDLASQPYATYSGNEQYLHCCLCVGLGQYQIDDIAVGDTPLTSFAEASIVRQGPAQAALGGPGTGSGGVADDQALVETLMHVVEEVQGVEMKQLDYAGPYPICRPERTANQICIDIALPLGLDSGRSITWRVDVQGIDDFGAPTSSWIAQATETYSTASAVPVRLSYTYTLATPGRKRCRLLRTDTRSTDDGSRHDISWLGLRSVLVSTGPTALDGVAGVLDITVVYLKLRISGQLSGVLRFRVKARRMLPIWDGSAWSANTLTRNPAWALARVLAARGVPDAQIDLGALLTLAQTWDTRQDSFDYRFDSQITTWDALSMIARVGNAVPLIRGGKYTFARDEPQAAPVAMFSMRNIRRGSFSLAFAFPEADPITALDLEYWDHRRWGNVIVTAHLENGVIYGYRGDVERAALGLTAPDDLARAKLRMPGVIGENQAIRIAVRMLAEGLYRRMVASYNTALDGLLPAPLQLILLQHDVGRFGQAGDVALWTEGTLTIGTTEALVWEPAANHYVRLMRPDGRLSESIAVTPGATDHDMVLASSPGFTPLFDDADRERTRYVFGPADRMGALAKLRAIVPRTATDIEHRVVLEDDRVHTADNEWLPSGAEQDPPGGGSVPDDSGGDRIVYLDSFFKNLVGSSGGDAWPMTFSADGTCSENGNGGAQEAMVGWLAPQPVTAGVAALYEIYVSAVTSGSVSGAALDTWLSLGTARTWTWNSGAIPDASSVQVDYTVQIRESATAIVQVSASISFELSSPVGGG